MTSQSVDPSVAPLRALLATVGLIASDLDLNTTLQRIVDAAAELSGAKYAALGVLDEGVPDRRVREFVTHGVSADERLRIGAPPTGHGILGVLIDDPKPLRVDNLADHPLSYGFPANHPPMATFLGAPIRIGNRVFGNLYLTERIGGGPFTEQDTELVVALAAAAGVIIENARLYERMSRHRQWLEAAASVSAILLGTEPRGRPADVIAEHALVAGDADGATLFMCSPGGSELRVAGSAGVTNSVLNEHVLMAGTGTGGNGGADADADADFGLSIPQAVLATGVSVSPGPGEDLLVRVGNTARVAGVLWLRWSPDHLDRVHESTVGSAEAFAAQVSLVLEVAESQEDRARLAVFEDRDRIGRDLHDLVIQRLFAVGLTLENTSRLAGEGRVADRISAAVDQLDVTIKDIRRTIFELGNPRRAADLRDEINETVAAVVPSLGFKPQVRTMGAVHSGVSDEVRAHLLAVLHEALSNVARHALATSVTVVLEVSGDQVVLTVADDGRGLRGAHTGNGLRNMHERAEKLGGTCELGPAGDTGTRVVWQVPAR
ncbi:MAG TPA: GAF domain-containing protein [Nakamurella sp.]